jgi:hypothetical protein
MAKGRRRRPNRSRPESTQSNGRTAKRGRPIFKCIETSTGIGEVSQSS